MKLNKINIKQSVSIPERIANSVIHDLYNYSQENDDVSLEGSLEVNRAYKHELEYLCGRINGEINELGKFKNLSTFAIDFYQSFKDINFLNNVCKVVSGYDGVGITENQWANYNGDLSKVISQDVTSCDEILTSGITTMGFGLITNEQLIIPFNNIEKITSMSGNFGNYAIPNYNLFNFLSLKYINVYSTRSIYNDAPNAKIIFPSLEKLLSLRTSELEDLPSTGLGSILYSNPNAKIYIGTSDNDCLLLSEFPECDESITLIPGFAFFNQTQITNFPKNFPNVKYIAEGAFTNTNLSGDVIFPELISTYYTRLDYKPVHNVTFPRSYVGVFQNTKITSLYAPKLKCLKDTDLYTDTLEKVYIPSLEYVYSNAKQKETIKFIFKDIDLYNNIGYGSTNNLCSEEHHIYVGDSIENYQRIAKIDYYPEIITYLYTGILDTDFSKDFSNVKEIKSNAFDKSSLKEVDLSKTSNLILNLKAFYMAQYLTNVILPDNLLGIPSSCFDYCYRLHDLIVPKSVIIIDSLGFGRYLTSLTLLENRVMKLYDITPLYYLFVNDDIYEDYINSTDSVISNYVLKGIIKKISEREEIYNGGPGFVCLHNIGLSAPQDYYKITNLYYTRNSLSITPVNTTICLRKNNTEISLPESVIYTPIPLPIGCIDILLTDPTKSLSMYLYNNVKLLSSSIINSSNMNLLLNYTSEQLWINLYTSNKVVDPNLDEIILKCTTLDQKKYIFNQNTNNWDLEE